MIILGLRSIIDYHNIDGQFEPYAMFGTKTIDLSDEHAFQKFRTQYELSDNYVFEETKESADKGFPKGFHRVLYLGYPLNRAEYNLEHLERQFKFLRVVFGNRLETPHEDVQLHILYNLETI